MIIDITDQLRISPALPMRRTATFANSVMPLVIAGIPDDLNGETVSAVTITVTNADGATFSASAEKDDDAPLWRVSFAPSCFTSYGFISLGLKISATLTSDSTSRSVTLAIGDLEVLSDSPDTEEGDVTNIYVKKGSDCYLKSEVVDDVQHYKLVVLVYDDDMGAWAFEPQGDYILVNDEFVEYEEDEEDEEEEEDEED